MASTQKNSRKQDVPVVDPRDWVEETPAGQRKILKPLEDDFHKAYLPKVVESAWYSFWEDQGLFKPRTEKNGSLKPKGKYVMAIPPPNFSTLYIPGCDHAGIATQAVVEKQLARNPIDNKSKRQDFSRSEFVRLCQDWKEDYHRAINKTIRRLGISVDWSREAFTMSPQLSRAVTETFVRLHSEGLIYRANRLIELEGTTKLDMPGYDKKIEFGTLTYFKYPIEGSNQTIEVATTRPETMLGDTGIAVHPQDDRYKDLVGKTVQHPIIPDRKLRIIADEYVEREFGTGAVKLTPAHDHNDFNLGKKHDLTFINILNEDGTLSSNAGPFAGEKRFNARYGVIEELKKLGLFMKQEPNKMVVPICSRSGDVVEPLLKPQWWMKMEPLTKPAIDVVESGELTIRPDVQKQQYLQWMRNLQDWCLSRQLWWGHQIPAYHVTVKGEASGDDTNDDYWLRTLAVQYPRMARQDLRSRELLSDYDYGDRLGNYTILVSRMIIFSLKLTGKVPFSDVYCHGLIRDNEGRKMSKSLGNVIDPIDVLDGISLDNLHQKLLTGNLAQSEVKNAEKFQKKAFPQGILEVGADALRFSHVNYTQVSGIDINFDVKTMHSYRKFCNKIYQATKYVLGKLREDFVPRESSAFSGQESLSEKWILTKMNTAAKQVNRGLEEREFARSTQAIYRYLYDELFDIYIENSKSLISDGTPEEARSAMDTLYATLESGLRLIPGDNTSSITIAEYPTYESSFDDPRSEKAYELVLGCSKGIRSLMAEYAFKDTGVIYIAPLDQTSRDTAYTQLGAIKSLSGKIPLKIIFTVSDDANVYLKVKYRVQDAAKEAKKVKVKLDEARREQADVDAIKVELSKVQDKDVTDTMQSAEKRKRDIEASLQALQETLSMFEKMQI
ncbi:MAG: hypothetical protein Q9171_005304 [Xanthocarpia ochracea]